MQKRFTGKGVPLSDQTTLPLATAIEQSAASFRAFLQAHDLCPLDLAVKSGIRYLTIWNISRGNPVRQEQAAIVRASLFSVSLSGSIFCLSQAAPALRNCTKESRKGQGFLHYGI